MNKILGFVLMCFISTMVFAQEEIVLEVAGENISKETFLDLYKKNNPNPNKKIDKKDLKEYLELFINYKLKIAEAKSLGLDTLPEYKLELDSYRKQLIEPYLKDKTVTDALIKEAYERSKEFVRASHILFDIPANADSKDTLEIYKKALEVRKRILKGENFESLAFIFSQDPSVKDIIEEGQVKYKGNKGDLGYFSVFNMIYPFENACYEMKKGDVSMPIRTSRGYHIIKLTDRIPAFFEVADFAHIWVNPENHNSEEDSKKIIEQAYEMLKNNISFDSVARLYSDDKYSLQKGGVLLGQRANFLPAEYILNLKNTSLGNYSEPFRSRLGYHIVKPILFTPIPSLEEQLTVIEQKISRDERSYRTIDHFVEKSKKDYNFSEDRSKLNFVVNLIDDSVFNGTWKAPKNINNNEILFTLGDYSFYQMNLLEEIEKNQKKQTPEYIPSYVEKVYNDISREKIIEYSESKLEYKNPELKQTIDEFRDGILIFTITDDCVWTKSIEDTVGLLQFYNNNSSRYMWGNRLDATIWNIYKGLDVKKANNIILKGNKKGWTNDIILEKLADAFNIKDSITSNFEFKWGKFEKGDNRIIDRVEWKKGISQVMEDGNKKCIVVVHSMLEPKEKTINEAKGIVTSDYQEYLEVEWIKSLRKKYPYKVYEDVVNAIN